MLRTDPAAVGTAARNPAGRSDLAARLDSTPGGPAPEQAEAPGRTRGFGCQRGEGTHYQPAHVQRRRPAFVTVQHGSPFSWTLSDRATKGRRSTASGRPSARPYPARDRRPRLRDRNPRLRDRSSRLRDRGRRRPSRPAGADHRPSGRLRAASGSLPGPHPRTRAPGPALTVTRTPRVHARAAAGDRRHPAPQGPSPSYPENAVSETTHRTRLTYAHDAARPEQLANRAPGRGGSFPPAAYGTRLSI